MGCCLSKTNQSCPSSSSPVKPPNLPTQLKTELKKFEEDEQGEKLGLKDKKLVGTQHSNSPDSDGLTRPTTISLDPATNNPETLVKDGALGGNGSVVRISNCSREEVDAILIHCGHLSRTTSATRSGSAGRRYSGSKRSHDFDRESNASIAELNCDDNDDERQSSGSHRRRTPSRRVSRSPGRRSRSPITRSSNGGNVKRVPVKRNLGEGLAASTAAAAAAAASPRSRSPAMSSGVNGVNSSRKAECTPHRRTPLTGIDKNSLPFNPLASKFVSLKELQRSKEIDEQGVFKLPVSVVYQNNQLDVDASAEQLKEEGNNGEQLELPPTSTRSRSSSRSRDLDVMNQNPATTYNSFIIQDIRNFHRKTSSSNKNCSIVESVPDLNSCNRPNPPCTSKDPNIESEVKAGDDSILMEPSLHEYITVRKRGSESSHGGDLDELESSGSNSFVAGSQNNQWLSSSSWEPNSADSSDCWTSSRSREDGLLVGLSCRAHSDSPRNLQP